MFWLLNRFFKVWWLVEFWRQWRRRCNTWAWFHLKEVIVRIMSKIIMFYSSREWSLILCPFRDTQPENWMKKTLVQCLSFNLMSNNLIFITMNFAVSELSVREGAPMFFTAATDLCWLATHTVRFFCSALLFIAPVFEANHKMRVNFVFFMDCCLYNSYLCFYQLFIPFSYPLSNVQTDNF